MTKAPVKSGRKIVENSNPIVHLTSTEGRKVKFQALGPLERFNLMGTLGPKASNNSAQFGNALAVCGVREIDGVPIMLPETRQELDQIILMVGDDILGALMEHDFTASKQIDVDLAGE